MRAAMEIVFTIVVGAVVILAVIALIARGRRIARRFVMPVLVLLLAVLFGIFLTTPQFGRRIQTALSTNVAESSPAPEFPELKTRYYDTPRAKVFDEANAAIRSLSNWKVVLADPATGSIAAEKRVLMFVDDVRIRVIAEGSRTRVDARSHSRVGKGDFGENRRHVAQFLTALDGRVR
jgi:uncharacterized protein (DUF1499 family)